MKFIFLVAMISASFAQAQVVVGNGAGGGRFQIQHNAARGSYEIQFPGISNADDVLVTGLNLEDMREMYGRVGIISLTPVRGNESLTSFYAMTNQVQNPEIPLVNIQPGTYWLRVASMRGGGIVRITKRPGEAYVYRLRDLPITNVPAGTKVQLQQYLDTPDDSGNRWVQLLTSGNMTILPRDQGRYLFKVTAGIFRIIFTDQLGRSQSVDNIRVD